MFSDSPRTRSQTRLFALGVPVHLFGSVYPRLQLSWEMAGEEGEVHARPRSPWGPAQLLEHTLGNEAADLPCHQLPRPIGRFYFSSAVGRAARPQGSYPGDPHLLSAPLVPRVAGVPQAPFQDPCSHIISSPPRPAGPELLKLSKAASSRPGTPSLRRRPQGRHSCSDHPYPPHPAPGVNREPAGRCLSANLHSGSQQSALPGYHGPTMG